MALLQVLLFDLIKGVLQKVSDWSSAYLPCSLYVQEGGRIVIGDAMSSFTLIEVDSDGQLQTVAKVSAMALTAGSWNKTRRR